MVVLTRNRIHHLGEYAFFSLDSLNYLDLSENLIDKLVNNSLAIENTYDKYNFTLNIRISLKLNRIAEISDHAFDKLKRPTNLDLSFNNITELRPNTFKTILSFDSSKIVVKGLNCLKCFWFNKFSDFKLHLGDKLKCDCGINWIYSNKTIRQKFSGPLRCADKRYFQELTQKDFKNCTNYYEIEW